MGGERQSKDLLSSSARRSKVWAGAAEPQHKGQQIPWKQSWAHSALCHNTALFVQVTFHSTLFLFLMWPRFLLMMVIRVFIKLSFLAVPLAGCMTISPIFNDMLIFKTIMSFRCTSDKHLSWSGKYYAFLSITRALHKRKQPQNASHLSFNKEMPCGAI